MSSPPTGGTKLMHDSLIRRLGVQLTKVNLQVNSFTPDAYDHRPVIVWFHHDSSLGGGLHPEVEWCGDAELAKQVARFVFVSDWQRDRYLRTFGLPFERCLVLRNATELARDIRQWQGPPWKCAYTSTPFRGLDILLCAWGRLRPKQAELHVWSSMKLYGPDVTDAGYQYLYELAEVIPGVTYHGIVANEQLLAELRTVHFLTYPSTFEETSCLSAIEAMMAGCRIIAPYLGALPETTAGYARLYPRINDLAEHIAKFGQVLAAELADPWEGMPELSVTQQIHSSAAFGWPRREQEWRSLIAELQ